MTEKPIQQFTRLLLLMAQQDHAGELIIGPAGHTPSPIKYKVADTWHNVSPPPAHILPDVIAELGQMAAFAGRPFPKEALIDVPYSGTRLRWVIQMTGAESDCVLTRIEEC